jgi:cytochrome P450
MSSTMDSLPLPLPREDECPFGPAPEVAGIWQRFPVLRVTCPTGVRAWLVTRYADVREVLGDQRRFSARSGQAGHVLINQPPDAPVGEGDFNRMDSGDHLRFRRVIAPAITTVKRTELFRPLVERIVNELLDELAAETEPIDLHGRFSNPLTSSVIAELLDVPEPERPLFHTVARALFDARVDADELAAAQVPLFEYVHQLVVRRMREPGEDVISVMAAKARAADRSFTELELTKIASGLLAAGYDTTASMITYSTLALLDNPDQFALLRDDPGAAANATEELIRLLGVGAGLLRVATVDTEIAGTPIAAGDLVVIALQSANHDPDQFPEPDRLDVTRPRGAHVGFGYGPHQCPGQHIARMELTAVLATLPRRVPSLRLAVPLDRIEFKKDTVILGPARLPVTWDTILPA